jgi:hypothetical protein
MDFDLVVQRSNNIERYKSCQGINGETAYLIIADHYTGILWGIATADEATPITWLSRWFAKYKPSSATFHYAALDEGSEMAKNPDVLGLLEKYGYDVQPTTPDPSFQNAPGECPHQDIGTPLRACFAATRSGISSGCSRSTAIFSSIASFHMGPGVYLIQPWWSWQSE